MQSEKSPLPRIVLDYVELIIRKMKYSRKARHDVRAELLVHFEDALRDIENEQDRHKQAEELIWHFFGDPKLLATLIRRGKKRCSPMWQKTVFAVLKVVGIILVLCLIRLGYMASGRPVMSVDYAQWMNEKVSADRDESLNAWYDYQKAVELLEEEMPAEIKTIDNYSPGQKKTPEDWQAIETFLKTESEAFKAFRHGASKPYYWNHYKTPEITSSRAGVFSSEVLSEVMPQITRYRKIGQRMASFQIPLAVHQDNIGQAVDDSIALYKFGQHISNRGLAIEQLVGLALGSRSIGVIADSLIQAELSSADLFRLQQTIETDYDSSTAEMDWSLEKALWYDEIQRSFTSDGQGNGRPLLRGIPFAVTNNTDSIKGFVCGFPNRKEVIHLIDERFKHYDELRKITPHTLHLKKEEVFLDNSDTLIFMQIEDPAVQKTIEISWRIRTAQAGLIATLSVLRFQKENKRLPESLNELMEKGCLVKMPMDPYSDKPLVYSKTKEGFTLYGVGYNFVDDGGVRGKDGSGIPTDWGQDGDFVFWPVHKEPPAQK